MHYNLLFVQQSLGVESLTTASKSVIQPSSMHLLCYSSLFETSLKIIMSLSLYTVHAFLLEITFLMFCNFLTINMLEL